MTKSKTELEAVRISLDKWNPKKRCETSPKSMCSYVTCGLCVYHDFEPYTNNEACDECIMTKIDDCCLDDGSSFNEFHNYVWRYPFHLSGYILKTPDKMKELDDYGQKLANAVYKSLLKCKKFIENDRKVEKQCGEQS